MGGWVKATTVPVADKEDGEIYRLGKELWDYNSRLSFPFIDGGAVYYKGQIHLLGGESALIDGTMTHHRSDHHALTWEYNASNTWTKVSTLPYNFYGGCCVVYNNEIHILGGTYASTSKYHYKWNGSNWSSVSTLPVATPAAAGGNCAAVVYNGSIHLLSGTSHYRWTGSSWVSVGTAPQVFKEMVVYDGAIHAFGGPSETNDLAHYKWTGSSWVSVGSLPYHYNNGRHSFVVYHDKIHFFGGIDSYPAATRHYELNGTIWTSLETLPYPYADGGIIVVDDYIHLIGGRTIMVENYNKFYTLLMEYTYFFNTDPFPGNLSTGFEYENDLFKYDGKIYIIVGADDADHYNTLNYTPYYYRDIYAWDDDTESWVMAHSSHVVGTKYHHRLAVFVENPASLWAFGGYPDPRAISSLEYYNEDGYAFESYNYVGENNRLPVDCIGGTGAYGKAISPVTSKVINVQHIFCGENKKHYARNGTTFNELADTPYSTYGAKAIIFKDELYIIGGTKDGVVSDDESDYMLDKMYKYNYEDDTYTFIEDFPLEYGFRFNGAYVYGDYLYVMGHFEYYRWDGMTWEEIPNFWINLAMSGKSGYLKTKLAVQNGIAHMINYVPSNDYRASEMMPASGHAVQYFGESSNAAEAKLSKTNVHKVAYLAVKANGYTKDSEGNLVFRPIARNVLAAWIHKDGEFKQVFKQHLWNWTFLGSLPSAFSYGAAVTYGYDIHILGGASTPKYHYSWNDVTGTWTSVSTLPYDFYEAGCVVFNNAIHILGGTGDAAVWHYRWSPTSGWAKLNNLPFEFHNGSALVYDDELHILGSDISGKERRHFKWDGSRWHLVSELPYDFWNGYAAVFNDEIHIIGGNKSYPEDQSSIDYKTSFHYKWNERDGWRESTPFPTYRIREGSCAVYKHDLYIIGGESVSDIYKMDEKETWSLVDKPYANATYGCACTIYKDEIHVFGGARSSINDTHYAIGSNFTGTRPT